MKLDNWCLVTVSNHRHSTSAFTFAFQYAGSRQLVGAPLLLLLPQIHACQRHTSAPVRRPPDERPRYPEAVLRSPNGPHTLPDAALRHQLGRRGRGRHVAHPHAAQLAPGRSGRPEEG